MYRIGIDLGGTNIAVGVVDDQMKIVGEGKVKTNAPRPVEDICDDIKKAVDLALRDAGITMEEVESVGIGAPGSVNPETGVIGFSNNLGFHNAPMVKLLEERLSRKVYIDNDANAAALGEMLAGAGKGTKNFVAITLGTGVGGGTIINGKMLLGSNFAGGELGHTVIVMDGEPCTCGRRGCWEAYASATGLIRQTKRKMEECRDSVMWELCDDNPENANGRTAFDAMRRGDEAGTQVVDLYCKYVACGLANIINIFQPEVLCIGGGISKEGRNLLNRIEPIVEKARFSKNIEHQTVIKTAELGNDAGIIGAAYLAKIY